MEIRSFKHAAIDPAHMQLLEALQAQIFQENFPGRLTEEAQNKNNLLSLVAFDGEKPVACKVGYELHPGVFYSWLGGVIPDYRRQGLARKLMQEQHRLLKEMDYKVVRTNGRNHLNQMIILNLQEGFQIIGTSFKSDEKRLSIQMEKAL